MPRPPDYGIIYNWDGAPHGLSEVPQSMEAFLEKMYAPMEDTQVGAHFWCIGEHAARWKSGVLELMGDFHGRRYDRVHSYVFTENVRAMLERGEDPQAEAIRRGHELGLHVYASVRMNDNHFHGAQPEDMAPLRHSGLRHPHSLTKMRLDHPEWLLGEQTSEWFALSWNFEVPEVREHRFAHIEEICRLYDWDGVELDWQRHAFHLPDDHGYRLRYVLTDLQRAVRRMTNALAEQRGKPFYVAARVSGSLEGCRHIGYDIPAWVEEGLVDILIPSGGSGTDPDVEVEAFRYLCRGTDVAVYPALYGGLLRQGMGPEDERSRNLMASRGIASHYYQQGADGVYVFNFHGSREAGRELLTQMGSAGTLRRSDKIYAATYRNIRRVGDWRNAEKYDRMRGEVPVALKRTMTGDGPTITINVADDLSVDVPGSIELRMRLEEWVRGDVVLVFWDGGEVEELQTSYSQVNSTHGYDISNAVWLSAEMPPDQAGKGTHRVKVTLVERNPHMAGDIVLTDVELVVRFGDG